MTNTALDALADLPLPRPLLVVRDYFPPQVGGISTMMARVMTEVAPGEVCCLAGCRGAAFIDTPAGRARVCRAALPFRLPTPFDTIALSTALATIKLTHHIRVLILATVGEGYIGLLAQRLFGLPYVVFAHGNEVLSLRDSRWPRALESFRGASAIMANSRYTAGLLGEFGIPPERIRVIHPGCDPHEFRPIEVDIASRNRLLDGRAQSFTLLTVGNLVARKGHDLAMKAVARLRRTIPNLLYVIAGSGPHDQELRRLANELGVADCVLFKGRVPQEDLTALYASSDVFLMPSRFLSADDDVEGFGIVYLEASACGRAVIGGMSGGIADAVLHGKTGLLVDPGDVGALEDAILRLWRDPALRASLGTAGRQRVISELTWSHFRANVRTVVSESVQGLTAPPQASRSADTSDFS
jgi:phosphatidylinositol alpha-1,6-mannosyltransferase